MHTSAAWPRTAVAWVPSQVLQREQHVCLPLRNGQVECTTIAALRQRQKTRAFRTFSRAHRHCRPSAHLTLRPQLAGTKHARPTQRARPGPTPAGAPTPKSHAHAHLTTLLRPRPQVPHHLCAASPLLLLCCVAFVPSHSLPPFAPPYLTSPATLRTFPFSVAPPILACFLCPRRQALEPLKTVAPCYFRRTTPSRSASHTTGCAHS